jgi:hypothetical protein
MKPHSIGQLLALGLAAVFSLAVGCSGVGPEPPDAREQSGAPPFSEADAVDLSKGTPIYVRLRQSISSSTAEAGQRFSALLDEPLVVNGKMVAPQGTAVSGCVVAARRSGKAHDAGYLRLTLSSLTINGKDIPIQTSSVFVEGGSYKNRNLAFTSGGSGGDTENLIGSIIGNGATAAFVTDKKEVGFAAERRMGFRLIQPLRIG